MNEKQLTKKVRQDAAKVKNDFSDLVGDSAVLIGKYEDNVRQAIGKARDDFTTWVEDGVSQWNKSVKKLTGNVKQTVDDTAATMQKDVGHGLSQYNVKAQKAADKVPGGFGKKIARYPWVAISIALPVSFLLGFLLKPARQPLG